MQRPRPAAAGTPDPGQLTARLFRGLYEAYDLHLVDGIHVVVPRGTPVSPGPAWPPSPGRSASTLPGPPGTPAPPPPPRQQPGGDRDR